MKQTTALDSPAGKRVFRAPGRVNLIGEHTDYNDGFVLPAAINFFTWVTISPRADRIVTVLSENFGEELSFNLDEPSPNAKGHWSDYVRGIAQTLEQAGYRLQGAQLNIRGDVPIGAGLSSSAAIEVASGYALLKNSGLSSDLLQLAKLSQRAENEFVGMRCGIMDQFVSCLGQIGRALLLDCRSLEYKLLPISEKARLVICNTMVRHDLASGEYNRRREDCELGVSLLAKTLSGVLALRDVTEADLEGAGRDLPETVYRRCRHVISENARVIRASAALVRNDLDAFGRLMNESHHSLRDDYEVSCAELDLMVQLAREQRGVYGARMTGGGFGGCTLNLVAAEDVDDFKVAIAKGYEAATGKSPEIYVSGAVGGVEEVLLNR